MKKALVIVSLVLAVVYALWVYSENKSASSMAGEMGVTHVIERQTLTIATVERGYLQAVRSHAITASRGTIEWVIKEGVEVSAGQEILKLDAVKLNDRIKSNEINLNKKLDDLKLQQGRLPTEVSLADSWIEDAIVKHDQAKEGLKTFRNVDGFKNIKKHDATVEEKEDKITQLESDILKKQVELDDSAFVDAEVRERLEKDFRNLEKSLSGQRLQLENSINDRGVYKSKTYPEELDKKKRALGRLALNVERERGRAQQAIINFKSKISNLEIQIKRSQRQMETDLKNLKKCIVTAPVAGVVIYGDPKSGNQHRIRQALKAGGTTWANYTLMTIPDMSKFSLQVSISEHARGRVAVGSDAEVEIPAIPGLMLKGTLTHISQLAKLRQPGNPSSPKVYVGTVELHEHDSRMVSGMTAKVRIVGEVLEDVVVIPIEAIFSDEGKQFCYVLYDGTAKRKEIELGAMNDFFAELRSGVAVGDSVYLGEPDDEHQ